MALHKANGTSNSISYEVKEDLGTLSPRKNGDAIKLRYISWNGREPKYDIRVWGTDDDGNEVCRKGLGLSGEELEELGKLIDSLVD